MDEWMNENLVMNTNTTTKVNYNKHWNKTTNLEMNEMKLDTSAKEELINVHNDDDTLHKNVCLVVYLFPPSV